MRAGALALAGLLLASACSRGEDDAEQRASGLSGAPAVPAPRAMEGGAPLTGLPIDPSRAGRPLLVVKIDNAPRARPQVGLNEADVVVEEAVEGGVTRFAAFFHSKDAATLGPVRSARSTDIFLISGLNRPLFAYSGANSAFQSLIARAPLFDVGVDTFPREYRRDAGRPAPHNQFSSTTGLLSHAPAGSQPPPRLFFFADGAGAGKGAEASPVAGVDLEYRGRIVTSAQYRWDGAAGTWKRSQGGAPHVDANGVQVAPHNVIVQAVNYRDTGFRDTSGAEVPEAELVGEGVAWVFTAGKLVRGRWRKPSPEALTEYLDGSGAPVPLTPGQTWVELSPPGTAAVAG